MGKWIIGLKGTELSFTRTGAKDIVDDIIIAISNDGTTTTLEDEAEKGLQTLLYEYRINAEHIFICGHSLGGYGAYRLCHKYKIKGASFNGAAPPTKPPKFAVIPGTFTHYHILGDIISSHLDSTTVKRVLIDKNHQFFFNTAEQHSTDRFWKADPRPSNIGNPTDEDGSYFLFGTTVCLSLFGVNAGMVAALAPGEVLSVPIINAAIAAISAIVITSPVPFSYRYFLYQQPIAWIFLWFGNFVVITVEKGSGLEFTLRKLKDYLASKGEDQINANPKVEPSLNGILKELPEGEAEQVQSSQAYVEVGNREYDDLVATAATYLDDGTHILINNGGAIDVYLANNHKATFSEAVTAGYRPPGYGEEGIVEEIIRTGNSRKIKDFFLKESEFLTNPIHRVASQQLCALM
jgi:hypothetical protein